MNLNIALNEQVRQSYAGTIEVKNEASTWLRDNLNIDLDQLNKEPAKFSTANSQRRLYSAKVRRNNHNQSSQNFDPAGALS